MNNLDRRSIVAGMAFAAAAPAISYGQTSPFAGKTVKIVVPFPPGGATDILGRLMADRFSAYWGTSVVVENKAGAGGNIGMESVAKSAPDGTTIMVGPPGLAINQFLYNKINFDPVKDFTPATLIAMVPNMLVTGKASPFKSVKELIDFGKANPGKLTYASSGIGTTIHLSGALFQKLTGINMVHAPYRGSAQAITDLIGGRTDLMFDNITSAVEQWRGGNLNALAVTTAKRSASAPELPVVADTVPGFDVSSWFGLWMPAGASKEFIATIHADTNRAIAEPAVKARMLQLGADGSGMTPTEVAAFLQAETVKWGSLIKEQGIKIDG